MLGGGHIMLTSAVFFFTKQKHMRLAYFTIRVADSWKKELISYAYC